MVLIRCLQHKEEALRAPQCNRSIQVYSITIMIIFPGLVAILNVTFAVLVLRQFMSRRRPQQLAWAAALLLGAIAAGCYLLLVQFTDVWLFDVYYLSGGILMAAYLGLGSVYLHASRRVAHTVAAIVVVASIISAVLLLSAHTDHAKLHHAISTLGPGTAALSSGPWKASAAVLNSFGAFAVIAGALLSAWRTYARQAPAQFVWANVLIATGTMVAGFAGVVADQGSFAGSFWAVLCVGFIILFAGFRLAAVRPRTTSSTSAVSPSSQHGLPVDAG
jgi:peptidoglycan/LPS O-acetylase OafA/YrhL